MNTFKLFPEGWELVEIKNSSLQIIDGDRGTNYPKKNEFSTSGYCLFLSTSNIKNDVFDFSTADFITEQKDALLRKGKLARNDIVITTRGTVGSVAFFNRGVYYNNIRINSGMIILRSGKGLNAAYLYHIFKSTFLKTQYSLYSSGSAQPQLPIKDFRRIKLPIPKLEQQQKIAGILSAYDDLIENNKRRIALLEKMAEEIYREWFVRFRFPGYQTAEFEKGIPKGWVLVPFSQAVEINPTEHPEKDELKPYVGMEALSTNSMFFKAKELRKGNSGSKFRNGDTLFPRITPCLENGKRGYVMTLETNEIAIGSTEFIVMREKLLTSEFIYLLCCFEPFRTHAEISMVGASGRQRVSENCFSFFLVAIPPKEILSRFTEIVRPMFESIRILSIQNSNLEVTRDNMLPRLISGKLSVEHLDIQFPPSMLNTEIEVS